MPRYFKDDEPRHGRKYDEDAPRRRRRDPDDDDDDDDDFPPPPPRRKKSQVAGATSTWAIVGGVFISMLVVAVVGYGIYESVTKGTPQAAVAYNDKLVAADRRLVGACQNFGDNLNQDIKTVRANFEHMQQEFKNVATEMQGWPVPGSKSARNLHAGFLHFVETRAKDAQKLAEIPNILENKNMLEIEKQNRINDLIQQFEAALNGPLAELTRLQQEFAREHSFILTPAPPQPKRR